MTPGLGHSAAVLTVCKRGDNAGSQGDYLMHLRSRGVTCVPEVFRRHPIGGQIIDSANWEQAQGYEMEYLATPPPPLLTTANLRTVKRLCGTIWALPWQPRSWREPSYAWQDSLLKWMDKFGTEWMKPVFYEAYGDDNRDEEVCIHGDATLSNLMWRYRTEVDNDQPVLRNEPVLIDPLAPLEAGYRTWCPGHRAVDLGKMLQSALGWETRLRDGANWRKVVGGIVAVLEGEDADTQRRAWFWCAVHLIRIADRSSAQGDTKLASEARRMAITVAENRNYYVPAGTAR